MDVNDNKMIMLESGKESDIKCNKVKELKKIVLDNIIFERNIPLSSLHYDQDIVIIETLKLPKLRITILNDRINMTCKDTKGYLHISIPSYIEGTINRELENLLDLVLSDKGSTSKIKYILNNNTYATFRFENIIK